MSNLRYRTLLKFCFAWSLIFVILASSCGPLRYVYPISNDVELIRAADNSPLSDEKIDRVYRWEYMGKTHVITVSIRQSFYEYYKKKKDMITSSPSIYSIYVTHPLDDAAFNTIARTLMNIAKAEQLSNEGFVGLIVSFVRSLPYVTDLESAGLVEHPRFPVETLVEMKADCEDSAFLLATLLLAVGLNTCLLFSDNHCAVGLAVNPGRYPYYEHEGKKYYYIEATRCKYSIGQIPPQFSFNDFQVLPLNPIPLVSVSPPDYLPSGGSTRMQFLVESLGSVSTENITVNVVLLGMKNEILYSETSPSFDLGIDDTALANFYMKFRKTGTYQLITTSSCVTNGIEYINKQTREITAERSRS